MTDFAHVYFITMLLFAAWYQFVHVGMQRLSVSTMLLTLLMVIHGIPMLIYQHLTGPDTLIYEAALSAVDREAILAKGLLAIGTMFFCVILGNSLANRAFRGWYRLGQLAQADDREGTPVARNIYQPTVYTRLAILTVGLWMLALMLLNGVPGKVVEYLSTEGLEIDKILLRREKGGIDNYFYNVVLFSIAPFLCAVALSFATRQYARVADKAIAVAMVGIVLLGKFGMLSKSPPVIFLLQLLLLWFLATGRRIDLRSTLLAVVAVAILFGLMAHAVVPELDFGAILAFLYYRVFDIPNEGLIEFLAAYPEQIPHGWGSSLLAIFADVPAKPASYFAVAALTRDDSLYASSSNSVFIADAWAEYAWPGVVFTATLAGFWTRAIDLYAFRHGRTDEAVCIVAGCAFGIFTMLSTAFPTALISGGLATIPLVSMLFVRRHRAHANVAQPLKSKA